MRSSTRDDSSLIATDRALSERGPYPLDVLVAQGTYEFTLTSVRIEATDTVAGYSSRPHIHPFYAGPGHHFVEVTLREHNVGVAANPVLSFWAKPGVKTVTVTADGVAALEKGSYDISRGGDLSVIDHVMQFDVPDETREALLHVILADDASQTIAFRLW